MDRKAVRHWVSALVLAAFAASAFGGEVNLTHTNKVDRWITNLIEIRMPENHFVNEYHTNWITQMRTNVVDFYATNIVTRTLTNRVVLDAFQTNYVVSYHTNIQTINVTNWQTAVVIKTNLTVQPVTTVVEVQARPALAAEAAPAATTSLAVDGLVLQAKRPARPAANGQIEIALTARDAGNPNASVQIQQWRVEREDGAILSFGQEQEFKRDLPVGRYKLEVKIQRDGEASAASTKALLEITPQEAVLRQRLTATR
jgi:hypothetical protein